MLRGRETETAAVAELVTAAAAGAGRGLVLRGRPGVGKSALLEYAAEYAATTAPGMRVLRATGSEPEQEMAFAALHQLLLPVTLPGTGLLEALPEPQRDAVRGALGLARSPSDVRFLVSAGVLSLLTEAAVDGGLLCLIDDFQWFDQASFDALLFAARRLANEGVAMLFALREGPAVRDVPELKVGDLDPRSAAELLTERSSMAAPVRDRIVALTGGNPLALREATDLLTPGQMAGRAPLPDPLPVGSDLFGDQVKRLPDAARLLLLVAAAEGQGDLELILRAAERLGGDPAALDTIEAAGLAEVDGARLRLRHPLIRPAAHATAGPSERRRVHTALADVLGETGDRDRRAWHRAAATLGQDEDVAAALAGAAERAQARGGYADAATALIRSAELTPDRAVRAGRLAGAATTAWLGGRPGLAETCLAEARELAEEPSLRADLLGLRGRFELIFGNADEACRIFLEGAALAGGTDPSRALELLADASEAAGGVGDDAAIIDIGRRAEALPGGFLRQAVAGIGAMLDGDAERGGALLRAALESADERTDAAGFLWASAAASYLGEADAAAAWIVRAGQVARVSGMTGQLPVVLEFLATAERINGRFALSAAIADEGLGLAREAGYVNSAAAHLANLAAVAAVQGRQEECERYAREALAIAIPHRLGLRVGIASYALGLLDLGLGRFAAAHARFESMVTAGPGAGHPTSVWRSTPDRVEAAIGCGEAAAARAAVSAYERWSVKAKTPQSRALLARCRALLESGEKAIPLYEEALRLHAVDGGSPFELARTQLLYGERLRRGHRTSEARRPLRAAADTFQRLGADPWAQRALNELRATGERASAPAKPDAFNQLTPQELRIARLVADGASNRDVAARLFLSPRTVEYHLYKIYPKLGISSRTELVRLSTQ
ncbi:AAA family ATPase [Actinomadura sp. 9N407]|uniref:helix-turn-helix transcriptional regulator n=1 Tax=Actinomadura sp. 9N407 TaxID=3375154 RepID=UPI0037B116FF